MINALASTGVSGHVIIYNDSVFHNNMTATEALQYFDRPMDTVYFTGWVEDVDCTIGLYTIVPLHHVYKRITDYTELNTNLDRKVRLITRCFSQIDILSASETIFGNLAEVL